MHEKCENEHGRTFSGHYRGVISIGIDHREGDMFRKSLPAMMVPVILAAFGFKFSMADEQSAEAPQQIAQTGYHSHQMPAYPGAHPAHRTQVYKHGHAANLSHQLGYGAPNYNAHQGTYPQLNAPLYPSPQPNTPTYVGGTYITNQALAPHEMLYPHTYRAMYGPYYWKVHGKWFLTPFGVRSHDHWQLQGTEVTVKYRSHHPLFSGFIPPGRGARHGGYPGHPTGLGR